MVVRARISIGLATVVALVALVLPVVTWTVVYPSRFFGSIVRATEMILTPTSITMGVELTLLLVVLRLRGVHARDLGMSFRHLIGAVVPMCIVWLATVLVLRLFVLLDLPPSEIFDSPPTNEILAQLLTNAPAEELVFRGLLITALSAWLYHRQWGTRGAQVAAVVGAALVFALEHVPRTIAMHMSFEAAVGYAASNVAFAVALGTSYLLTGNLWFCSLVHTLVNVRPSPWPAPRPLTDPYALFAVIVAIGWFYWRRRTRAGDRAPAALTGEPASRAP